MQERVESDQIEQYIIHQPLDRFFINMHGFHNSHLLRATLPRDLVAPIPLFPDRQAKHFELAAQLREQVAGRKIALAKKRKQPVDDETGDEVEVEVEARPRKRQKAPGRPRSKKAAVKRSKEVPVAHSMIANRAKRSTQLSARARAAQEAEGSASELEEYLESSSSDEDIYMESESDSE
jgi:hypothetical protein